jgi:ribosomal protein S12
MAGATLDEKGNLIVLGFGTRDLRPGFRYVLGTVRKDAVKTVNGKALPKE